MKAYFLKESDFESFLTSLMKSTKVIGPVAKKNKFIFHELKSPSDLRLDYDVTILPAKKAVFPTTQALLNFDKNGQVTSCLAPEPQVLLGLHFYEMKAMDMLDELFRQGHPDKNYLALREMTTILLSNIQTISPRAFWASVGKEVKPQGQDGFFTKIQAGYLYESFTEKGNQMLAHASFVEASNEQIEEAKKVNEDALNKCSEKLEHSSKEISEKMRKSFGNDKLWEEMSQDCFSCGTCNLVCPTCYCFDVQDTWNLDQVSGTRARTWDGCLLKDFSTVSLGGKHYENFREKAAARFRHRMMRKATYLNEKLGGPACVGCGRCSIGCVPDIADPVKIIKKVMEE